MDESRAGLRPGRVGDPSSSPGARRRSAGRPRSRGTRRPMRFRPSAPGGTWRPSRGSRTPAVPTRTARWPSTCWRNCGRLAWKSRCTRRPRRASLGHPASRCAISSLANQAMQTPRTQRQPGHARPAQSIPPGRAGIGGGPAFRQPGIAHARRAAAGAVDAPRGRQRRGAVKSLRVSGSLVRRWRHARKVLECIPARASLVPHSLETGVPSCPLVVLSVTGISGF